MHDSLQTSIPFTFTVHANTCFGSPIFICFLVFYNTFNASMPRLLEHYILSTKVLNEMHILLISLLNFMFFSLQVRTLTFCFVPYGLGSSAGYFNSIVWIYDMCPLVSIVCTETYKFIAIHWILQFWTKVYSSTLLA